MQKNLLVTDVLKKLLLTLVDAAKQECKALIVCLEIKLKSKWLDMRLKNDSEHTGDVEE